MNGYAQFETDRRVLTGIFNLLLALANLAEFAAGQSKAMRNLLFVILVPAETTARKLVADIEWDVPDLLARNGDNPADLWHLAASFRAMATLLAALLETDLPISPVLAISEMRKPTSLDPSVVVCFRVSASPAPDTS